MFRRRALRRRLAAAGAPALPDDTLRRLARVLDAPAASECVPAEPAVRLAVTKLIRFPELQDLGELRRLPQCREQQCCNPHHWSRLVEPETPPPPYSRYAMDDVKPKDHGESTADGRRTDHERLPTGSFATDGEERQTWETEWCRLAYWELATRVGRQFGVSVRCVDVFGGAGAGRSGLCLDALDQPPGDKAEQVRKIRAKIGLGVTLALEADGVWLYNRGRWPVFASAPRPGPGPVACRVAPGHCLRVFDPAAPPAPAPPAHVGPVDARSVRISFAKGWGPKYSRRDVTACPCWLEVLLAPPS